MLAPLRIRLFGGFEIRVGEAVGPEGAWRLRKAKSLVKLLALAPERRIHRDVAIELRVPRPVDLSHSTRADRREDLVGSETRAGRK